MRAAHIIILMVLLVSGSHAAFAQSDVWSRQHAAAWSSPPRALTKPVLDPSTGSYYQLFNIDNASKLDWWVAERASNELYHNGRRGRLATIKSGDTHFFLMQNFSVASRGGKYWIGLKMACGSREFLWADGSNLTAQQFTAFTDKRFRKETVSCTPDFLVGAPAFLPVSLVSTESTFRWEISGPRKWYSGMLVEFPPPAQDKQASLKK